MQPVEIARKLAKEMDAHKTASVQRVYVPNEYTVWLAPEDYERFKDYESSLAQELSSHLLEHARHHDYDLLTRPVVNMGTAGFGAPVVSTAEDGASVGLSLAALFAPLLCLVALILLAWVLIAGSLRVRRWRRRRGSSVA